MFSQSPVATAGSADQARAEWKNVYLVLDPRPTGRGGDAGAEPATTTTVLTTAISVDGLDRRRR